MTELLFPIFVMVMLLFAVIVQARINRGDGQKAFDRVIAYLRISARELDAPAHTTDTRIELIERAYEEQGNRLWRQGRRALDLLVETGAITHEAHAILLGKNITEWTHSDVLNLNVEAHDQFPALRAQGAWEEFSRDLREFRLIGEHTLPVALAYIRRH